LETDIAEEDPLSRDDPAPGQWLSEGAPVCVGTSAWRLVITAGQPCRVVHVLH
jgi:hypothetical protein